MIIIVLCSPCGKGQCHSNNADSAEILLVAPSTSVCEGGGGRGGGGRGGRKGGRGVKSSAFLSLFTFRFSALCSL